MRHEIKITYVARGDDGTGDYYAEVEALGIRTGIFAHGEDARRAMEFALALLEGYEEKLRHVLVAVHGAGSCIDKIEGLCGNMDRATEHYIGMTKEMLTLAGRHAESRIDRIARIRRESEARRSKEMSARAKCIAASCLLAAHAACSTEEDADV